MKRSNAKLSVALILIACIAALCCIVTAFACVLGGNGVGGSGNQDDISTSAVQYASLSLSRNDPSSNPTVSAAQYFTSLKGNAKIDRGELSLTRGSYTSASAFITSTLGSNANGNDTLSALTVQTYWEGYKVFYLNMYDSGDESKKDSKEIRITLKDSPLTVNDSQMLPSNDNHKSRIFIGDSTVKPSLTEYISSPSPDVIPNPDYVGVKTLYVEKKMTKEEYLTTNDDRVSTLTILASEFLVDNDNADTPIFTKLSYTHNVAHGSGSTVEGVISESGDRLTVHMARDAASDGYVVVSINYCSYTASYNGAPTGGNISSSIGTIYLVIYIENGRPYMTEDLVYAELDLSNNRTATFTVSDFLSETSTTTSTFATDTADSRSVLVPEYNFVMQDGTYVIDETSPTGFNTLTRANGETYSYIVPSTAPTAERAGAYAMYTVTANEITITALHPSNYSYADYTDYSKLQNKGTSEKGHFFVQIRVNYSRNPDDTEFYVPLAIKVSAEAPIEAVENDIPEMTVNGGESKYFTPLNFVSANGSVQGIGSYDGSHITESAYQASALTQASNGYFLKTGATQYTSTLGELNFISPRFVANFDEYKREYIDCYKSFFDVELCPIYISSNIIGGIMGSVDASVASNQALDPNNVKMRYSLMMDAFVRDFTYTGVQPTYAQGAPEETYYVIYGLKVTGKASMVGKFAELSVPVVTFGQYYASYYLNDITGEVTPGFDQATITLESYSDSNTWKNTVGGLEGAVTQAAFRISVNNSSLEYASFDGSDKRQGNRIKKNQSQLDRDDEDSEYYGSGSAGSITYKLYVGEAISISPYDLLYDADARSDPAISYDGKTYNSNPNDADFSKVASSLYADYYIDGVTTVLDAQRNPTTTLTHDVISIAGESQLSADASVYADLFTFEINKANKVPVIRITAINRTPAAAQTFVVTYTDGGGSTLTCTISITVLNSSPEAIAVSQQNMRVTASDAAPATISFTVNQLFTEKYDLSDIPRLSLSGVSVNFGENGEGGDASGYVRAELQSRLGVWRLSLTALSCTEQLAGGVVYVHVSATDNYSGGAKIANNDIAVKVLNTELSFSTSNTRFTEKEGSNDYTWNIQATSDSSYNVIRYIAFDEHSYNYLVGLHGAINVSLIAIDVDAMQSVKLTDSSYKQIPNADAAINDGDWAGFGYAYTQTFIDDSDQYLVFNYQSGSEDNNNCTYLSFVAPKKHAAATKPMRLALRLTDGKDEVVIKHLLIEFMSAGMAIMEQTYNTTPSIDAADTTVDSRSMLEFKNIQSYQIASNSAGITADSTQEDFRNALNAGTLVLTDKFKKQYFAYEMQEDEDVTKRYPSEESSAFYYDGINVPANQVGVLVPISYLATPMTYVRLSSATVANIDGQGATTHSEKISFSGLEQNIVNSIATKNGDAISVSQEMLTVISARALSTLSISDGTRSWSGDRLNSNPYVTVSIAEISHTASDNDYLNKHRGYVDSNSFTSWNGTLFEDTYGLKIVKKSTRAASSLTLTAALELYNSSSQERITSNITTELTVDNSKFTLDASNAEYSLDLKKGESKTVRLARESSGDGEEVITYKDEDYVSEDEKDEVIFNSERFKGSFTQEEIDYMNLTNNISSGEINLVQTNLGIENMNGLTTELTLNNGYDKFFDVAFSNSDRSMLTITTKQKTALNSTNELDFTSLGLVKDTTKNAYYFPLRLVVFDDKSQTGMLKGSYSVIVIKVFISNSQAKRDDDTLTSINVNDGASTAYYGRRAVIAQNESVEFNLIDYISEPDVFVIRNQFATSADEVQDVALTHDYLIMPTTVPVSDTNNNNMFNQNDRYPVDVYSSIVSGDSKSLGGSISQLAVSVDVTGSTIKFTLKQMFNGRLQYVVRLSDSTSTIATETIVFEISASNTAPEVRTPLQRKITMRTGDSFELITTDKDSLQSGAQYGFAAVPDAVLSEYPQDAAADLDGAFKFDSSIEGEVNLKLGALVMATDSAPSALFVNSYEFSGSGRNMFDVTAKYKAGTNQYGYEIKALGVVSTTLSIVVHDEGGLSTTFSIEIEVVSTAPTVTNNTNNIPGLAFKDGNYEYVMSYGSELTLSLDMLAEDIDLNDNQSFTLTDVTSTSAIRCEATTSEAKSAVKFTAVDFSRNLSKINVTFKVSDAHGKSTELINFIFTVDPTTITTEAATAAAQKSVAIKSYADYQLDPYSSEFTYSPVAAEKGMFFNDNDASAPSARYSLYIYSRLEVTDSGFASSSTQTLIYSYNYNSDGTYTVLSNLPEPAKTLRSYYDSFMTFSLSADGKNFTITPVSASGDNELPLCFVAEKYVVGDVGDKYKTSGYFNFSVANSTVTAVSSSEGSNFGAYNSGQSFLEFSGSAASSQKDSDEGNTGEIVTLPNGLVADTYSKRTYKLYNTSNPDLGLFRDADILNNSKYSTDTIDYKSFVIADKYKLANGKEGTTEVDARNTNDPVLSLSYDSTRGELSIVILRRIKTTDQSIARSGLDDSYVVPVVITAVDRGGNAAEITINVTVNNHAPGFNIIDATAGASLGYTLNHEYSGDYVMNASVEYNSSLNVTMTDIISDYDYSTQGIGNEVLFFESIDGDAASLHDIDLNDNKKHIVKSSDNSKNLFEINVTTDQNANGINYNKIITIKAINTERNARGVARLRVRDMAKNGLSPILTINLTVANTAPVILENPPVVNVLGNNTGAANTAIIDVLDFVGDVNDNDAVVASESNPYFVYFDNFSLPALEEREQSIFGDKYSADTAGENFEMALVEYESNTYHQKIRITAKTGVYGYQKFSFTVIDSGYSVGTTAGVVDGKSVTVNIVINVLRPIEDYAAQLAEKSIRLARGVKAEITPSLLLDDNSQPVPNSTGYEIVSITAPDLGDYVEITNSASDVATSSTDVKWYVTAKNELKNLVDINITLKAGGKTLTPMAFKFELAANSAPRLISDHMLISAETQLDSSNMLYLSASDLLIDDDTGDIVTLIANTGTSNVSALIEASVAPLGDTTALAIKVKSRGKSTITFKAQDAAQIAYTYSFVVTCEDAPKPEFFVSIMATYQSNPVLYGIITGGVVLLIIAVIIVVIVIRKRRLELAKLRMLEELGALDNINEQLGLPEGYESMNPMLGAGESSQTAPQGLNAGESDLPTVEIGAPVPGTKEYDMFIRQRDGIIPDDDEDDDMF